MTPQKLLAFADELEQVAFDLIRGTNLAKAQLVCSGAAQAIREYLQQDKSMQSTSIATNMELLALIEKAKNHVMTKEEKDAQRKSWVIGEFMLAHPQATRAYAEAVYSKVVGT